MTTPHNREPEDDYIDDEDRDVVIDPDFELLGRYLVDDDLTPEERRAIEERTQTDPKFWGKVGPLVGLFALTMPVDLRAVEEVFGPMPVVDDAPPVRAARPQSARPQSARPRPTRSRSAVPPFAPQGTAPIFAPSPTPPTHLPEPFPAFPDVRSGSWLTRLFEPGPVWRVLDTVVRVTWKIIKFAVGFFFAVMTAAVLLRNWKPLVRAESRVFMQVSHADSAAQAEATTEDIRDTYLGRQPVIGTGRLIQDSAGPGEKRIVLFDDHSRATILPGSRVAYRIPTTFAGRVEAPPKNTVTIDGEVIFVAREPWLFITRLADISVEPGSYAIRSTPYSGVLQLSVGTGSAYVRLRGEKDSLHVVRGDYLSVPATGAVQVSHDSTGFPLFGDTASIRNQRKGP